MASLSTKSGKTRGKNPREITFEAFDLEKPESLPKSIKEFMEVTKVEKEPELVELLVNGFNDSQYSAASDEIGEYINDSWDKEFQNQYRLVVRNFSKNSGMSIEAVVNMVKPAMEAGWTAKVAAKAAAAQAGVVQSA